GFRKAKTMRGRWLPLTVLAVTILAVGGLTACSNNTPADSVDRILINGEEPARGLIPAAADDEAGIKIIDLLFAGLVTYDKQGQVINDVAQEITDSSDHKT
ncbi:ABC-type dipeptide/oligopeptide/nickel transport system, secreted component, partial [human gut metagenome]